MQEPRSNPSYYGTEHLACRGTLRRFVAREIAPHAREWDEAGLFSRALYEIGSGAQETTKDLAARQLAL